MLNWILKLMPYKETTEWLADLNQAMRGRSNILELTERQLQSFKNLQEATFHLDTLVHPRWDKPFTLHVDASKKGTFAILSQENRIISYSRIQNHARLSMNKKAMLLSREYCRTDISYLLFLSYSRLTTRH